MGLFSKDGRMAENTGRVLSQILTFYVGLKLVEVSIFQIW